MEEFELEEVDFGNLPEISIDDLELLEGNEGLTAFDFTVTLSRASEDAVAVDFITVQQTARDNATFFGSVSFAPQDYNPRSGSIKFAPGETEQTITVDERDFIVANLASYRLEGDEQPHRHPCLPITLRGTRAQLAFYVQPISDI